MIDGTFRSLLPRGVGFCVDEVAVRLVTLLLEFSKALSLGIVDNHPGRDAVAFEQEGQCLVGTPFPFHGETPCPSEGGAVGLGVGVKPLGPGACLHCV